MSGIASRSLKRRVLRAGGWTLAGYGVTLAIRLGSTLIMTRLLAPEMFDVIAIASMVMTILSMTSGLGLRSKIVHSPRGEAPSTSIRLGWSRSSVESGRVSPTKCTRPTIPIDKQG